MWSHFLNLWRWLYIIAWKYVKKITSLSFIYSERLLLLLVFSGKVLESLRVSALAPSEEVDITDDLKRFTEQCSLGFAQRHLAAQKDAYPTILSCCEKSLNSDAGALSCALSALSSLTDGQPDLLDEQGRNFLMSALRVHEEDPVVTCLGVRTVRHCCLKHEQNRQDLVKAGVLPLLTGAIGRHTGHAEVVREACAALRVMTFDDDVRVPFGHAHEHAKMIVLEHSGLKVIIQAAKGMSKHRGTAHEGDLVWTYVPFDRDLGVRLVYAKK